MALGKLPADLFFVVSSKNIYLLRISFPALRDFELLNSFVEENCRFPFTTKNHTFVWITT